MADINSNINDLKALIILLNSVKEGFVDITDSAKVTDLYEKLSKIDFKNTVKLSETFSNIAGLSKYINKNISNLNQFTEDELDNLIKSHEKWEEIKEIITDIGDINNDYNDSLSDSIDLSNDLVNNLFNLKNELNKIDLSKLLSASTVNSLKDNISEIALASKHIGDSFDINPFEDMENISGNISNLISNIDQPTIELDGVTLNIDDAIQTLDSLLDHSIDIKDKMLKLRFDKIFEKISLDPNIKIKIEDAGVLNKAIDYMAGLVTLTESETKILDDLLSGMSMEEKYLLTKEASLRAQNQIVMEMVSSNKKVLSTLKEFRPLYLYLNEMGQGIIDGFEEGLSILPKWIQNLTGMDIAASKMRDGLTQSLKASLETFQKTGSMSQGLSSFVGSFANSLASAINPLVLFLGLITLISAALINVNSRVNDISASLGISRNNAFDLYKSTLDLVTATGNTYVTQERVYELLLAHKNLYGQILDISDASNGKMISTLSAISSQYGVSMEKVYGMVNAIQLAGADQETATNLASWAAKASDLAGISFDNIAEDLQESSAVIAKYYHNLPKDAVKAAVEFRRMGMSLKQVSSLMDTTFDPDNTLKNAAELSVMTNGVVDLQRVFNMNLKGASPADIMRETTKQFDDLINSGEANRYNLEKFAESFGVPLDELQKGYKFRKMQYQLDAKQRDLIEKHLSKMSDADLANASTMVLASNRFENVEKLSQSWNKIKTTLAAAVLPLVEALANSIDSILPLIEGINYGFKILSGIVKFLKPVFEGMLMPFQALAIIITKIGSLIKYYILEPLGLITEPMQGAVQSVGLLTKALQGVGIILSVRILSRLPLIGKLLTAPLKILDLFNLNIIKGGKNIVKFFGNNGKAIFSGMLDKLGPIGSKLKGLFSSKSTTDIPNPAEAISDSITESGNKSKIFDNILEKLKNGFNKLGTFLQKLFKGINDIIVNFSKTINTVFTNVSKGIRTLLTNISSGIGSFITNIFKSLTTVGNVIKSLLTNISSGIGSFITNIFKSLTTVGNVIKSLLTNISSGIGSFITNISKSIGTLINSITKSVGTGIESLMKSISKGLNSFGTKSLKGALVITAVAGSMFVLAKALKQFNGVDWDMMAKAGASLVGITAIALVLGSVTGKALTGALTLALIGAALIPLAFALKKFEGVNWKTLGVAAVALIGLTLAVIGLGAIMLSEVGAAAITLGSIALAAMGAALIPLAYSLNMVSDALLKLEKVNGSNLISAATGIKSLGSALISFSAGSFVNTVTSLFSSDPVKKLKRLAELSNPIKVLSDSFKVLVTSLSQLAPAINKLDVDKLNNIKLSEIKISDNVKSKALPSVNTKKPTINHSVPEVPIQNPGFISNQIDNLKVNTPLVNQPITTPGLKDNSELINSIRSLTNVVKTLENRPIIVKIGDQELKTLNRNLKKYNNY